MNAPQQFSSAHEAAILPEVRHALTHALSAHQTIPSRPSSARTRRVVAATLAAALLSGSALAATAGWVPRLGADDRGHPAPATSPLPVDQTTALAVLRSPQTARDRSPRIAAALTLLTRDQTDGVHTDAIRLLHERTDAVTFLMPVERDGADDPTYANAQPNMLCLVTASEQHRVAGHPDLGPNATKKCGSLTDLRHGRIVTGGQWAGQLELTGLVPDGVTRVETTLSDRRVLSADVTRNYYRIEALVPEGTAHNSRVTWLDRAGTTVKQE